MQFKSILVLATALVYVNAALKTDSSSSSVAHKSSDSSSAKASSTGASSSKASNSSSSASHSSKSSTKTGGAEKLSSIGVLGGFVAGAALLL